MKNKLIQKLSCFADHTLGGRDFFMCVYGSHATGHAQDGSDIDVLIAIPEKDDAILIAFGTFLRALHIEYNLGLDDEVPYHNKIVVTYQDIEDVILLKPFITQSNNYVVRPIEKTEQFLTSDEMRLRLLFNALTTPHMHIAGSYQVYDGFKKQAEKALTELALQLTSKSTTSNPIEVLLIGPDGEEGEMYLGYKRDRKEVVEHLVTIINNHTSI
jgi:predicted nucleotidyltransferase